MLEKIQCIFMRFALKHTPCLQHSFLIVVGKGAIWSFSKTRGATMDLLKSKLKPKLSQSCILWEDHVGCLLLFYHQNASTCARTSHFVHPLLEIQSTSTFCGRPWKGEPNAMPTTHLVHKNIPTTTTPLCHRFSRPWKSLCNSKPIGSPPSMLVCLNNIACRPIEMSINL